MTRLARLAGAVSLGSLGLVLLPGLAALVAPAPGACPGAPDERGLLAGAEAHATAVWPLPPPRHLLAGAGSACGQEPTPPPAEAPAADADTAGAGSVVSAPDDVLRLTLEEAVRTALLRSPDLSQAESVVDEAEATRLSAWGSFLPDVFLGYGYSNSSTGRLDPTGQAITNTSWFSELIAEYDLFDGLRRFTNLRSARRRVSAADARFEERRFETILRVKTAFYGAIASRQLVEVERDRVGRQEAQLDSVRIQLELGRVARTDVLRSEVALNNARLALIRAENDARTAAFRLARVVGLREPALPAEDARLDARPLSVAREEVIAMAMRSGPSVEAARAEADAASSEAWSARSLYLPNLQFSGGYVWQNDRFPPENRSWQIFVYGSYPLFNGFQREAEVSRNSARADAARAAERAAELELRAAVDSAYSLIRAALASISLADQTVALAGEELSLQQERFRLGRGAILEVQEAQIALQQAEVDLVRARLDYQVGLARLEFLLGEELPADGTGDAGAPEGRQGAIGT